MHRRLPGRRGRTARRYRVGIERVHLEEDTGKSLHVGGATGRIHGADYSLVDYNRAGIPLVEIVTKPVAGTGARAPEVARAYVTELRDLLRALGVSDVRMEQGSLRCDVNISLTPRGARQWGTRTETKNVNSLRSVERAVRYEIEPAGRRARRAAAGSSRRPGTSTRTPATTTLRPAARRRPRTTGTSPSPTWCRSRPTADWVERARAPPCPSCRRPAPRPAAGRSGACPTSRCSRWSTPARSTWSRRPSTPAPPAADARKWWLGELARRANEPGVELADAGDHPGQVARVVALVDAGTLNDKLARQVVDGVLGGEGDARRGRRGPRAGRGRPTTAR